MVRCAFAHNPALPVWEALGKDYSRHLSFAMRVASLSVDLASLHGHLFEYCEKRGADRTLAVELMSDVRMVGSSGPSGYKQG